MKTALTQHHYPVYQQYPLSPRQLKRIFEPLSLLVFASDLDGRLVFVSDNVYRLAGWHPNELLGQPLLHFISEEYHQDVNNYLQQVILGTAASNFEALIQRKEGSSFPASWNAAWDATDKLFYGIIQDITEQKAKASLQELQKQRILNKSRQINEVLERITDGFYALDEEWRITYANTQAERILNLKWEGFIGRNIWECFPQLRGSILDEQYSKAMSEKTTVHFSTYLDSFNSWYEIHVYPSDTGLSIFFQDISKRIKEEEERQDLDRKIKQQNEQLANVLERINQGFFSLDKDFRVTYWNQKAEEFYGVSRKEMAGQFIRTLYSEEAQAFYRPMLLQVLSEQKPLHSEHICPQKGVWAEISMYPSGEGVSVFFKDIDQRKRTEEELKKLSQLVQETDNIVVITNANRRITWVNGAFTKVNGFTLQEVIGQKPGDFLQGPESDPETKKLIREKTERGEPFSVEMLNYTKAKEKYWVEIHAQPIRNANGKLVEYYSIQTVITERKEMEAQLQLQQKKINAAVIAAQEKERALVGQELHDNVNQVLTTVKLYTELCRDGIGNTGEIMNRSIKLLQESIDEIRSLSKRLSAPSLGSIRLKDTINELVDALIATNKLSLYLDTSGIENLEVDHQVHLCVYRILQEHLANILRHADAKEVQIILCAKNSELALLVNDDGKGFNTKKKRSGMGITNMATRTEALNGTFELNSAPGKGCQLKVRLPLN